MNLLTRIKSWQLFLALISVMFLPSFLGFEHAFEIQMYLYIILFFSWQVSICKLANASVQKDLKGNNLYFYISLTYMFLYTCTHTFSSLSIISQSPLFNKACLVLYYANVKSD